MRTASSTACQENWRVYVILPSGVEQSNISTQLNPILESPGIQEASVLGLRVAGGESGLPEQQKIAHSPTVFPMLGLRRAIVWHPVSCSPTLVVDLRLFLACSGFSWLFPDPASAFPAVVQTSSDRTAEVETVLSEGLSSASVIQFFVPGDRAPSEPWPQVLCTVLLPSAPPVLLRAVSVSPQSQLPAGSC